MSGSALVGAEVVLFAGTACEEELARGVGGDDGAFTVAVTVSADAETLLTARQELGGVVSACTEEPLVYVNDRTAPVAPALEGTVPASPSDANEVELPGTSEPEATVTLHTAADCSDGPLDTVTADGAGAFVSTAMVPDDSVTTFHARATDAAGNASACSAGVTYEEVSAADDPRLVFPPGPALTDADAITVRGVVEDPRTIAGITVGGAAATTDDGFATFRAEVSLAAGTNDLTVDVERVGGAVETAVAAVRVERRDTVDDTGPLALDAPRGRLLMVDPSAGVVEAIDRSTGEVTVFSGGGVGSGPALRAPRGLAVDAAAGRAWVADAIVDAVFEIDLASGDRTVISDDDTGGGILTFDRPAGLAYDAARDRLIVVDEGLDTVLAVTRATGDRVELTGGLGVLDRPEDVAVLGDAAFVVDGGNDSIVEVDLVTGTRAILADDTTGAGPDLASPRGIAVAGSGASAVLLVADGWRDDLFEVDPETGDRSRPREGVVPGLVGATDAVADASGDTVWVAGLSPARLWTVDRAAGTRSPLPTPGLPAGPAVAEPSDVVADATLGRLYVGDRAGARVVEVTLASGARRVLVAAAASGPTFDVVQGLALDAAGDRLFIAGSARDVFAFDRVGGGLSEVATAGGTIATPHLGVAWDPGAGRVLFPGRGPDALVGYDVASGARAVVSGDGTGTGPAFGSPSAVVVEDGPAPARAFVIENLDDRLVEVDLATGDRTVVSGDGAGGGATWLTPTGGAWDAAGGRLLVTEGGSNDALLAVDATDGTRTVVSRDDVGRGPVFDSPAGVAVGAGDVAFVAARQRPGVWAVDLTNGDRVLVAR
ncbi:MAG TPA: hypothetical protein RMH99_17475 [Sandaracinaceae bacterium LLY-WYZ-13_1]|nr:hypothetical protein [Sandaracinaceae bacterium LLY-WYZ-13_1]